MLTRLVKVPKSQHFFLFGARATGKTTLLQQTFSRESTAFFDLLEPDQFDRFSLNPSEFREVLQGLPENTTHVVIDEIQRAPQLLDIVQSHMRSERFYFGLTGSSARKLKRGHANLLGGRAVTRTLWPLSVFEHPNPKAMAEAKLNWGGLPLVLLASENSHRKELLRAYISTYLAEEVVAEQLVRNLTPFRRFLPVAAQMNGKIINASSIGRDIGVSHNTVTSYFEILEDTLIGFRVPAFSTSVRKKIRAKSKFYFIDAGIVRALNRSLEHDLRKGTSVYGEVFEHMVVLEIKTLATSLRPDWEISYLQTESGNEVDIVIDKGLGKLVLVEIKSTENISKLDLGSELKLVEDTDCEESYVLSQDPLPKQMGKHTKARHWIEGLKEIFDLP